MSEQVGLPEANLPKPAPIPLLNSRAVNERFYQAR